MLKKSDPLRHSETMTERVVLLCIRCNEPEGRAFAQRALHAEAEAVLLEDGLGDGKPGTGGAALALPPEKIDLYRICSVVDPEAIDKMIGIHGSPSPFCPVGRNIGNVLGKTYDTLKNNLIASMKTITLEQILADYHAVLAEEKNKKS